MNRKELESAINSYVKTQTEGSTFPTGWAVVVSLAPSEASQGSDSYLTMTSEGLPLHSLIGLLQIAQNDMRNNMMMSMLGSMVQAALDDEEEDDSL